MKSDDIYKTVYESLENSGFSCSSAVPREQGWGIFAMTENVILAIKHDLSSPKEIVFRVTPCHEDFAFELSLLESLGLNEGIDEYPIEFESLEDISYSMGKLATKIVKFERKHQILTKKPLSNLKGSFLWILSAIILLFFISYEVAHANEREYANAPDLLRCASFASEAAEHSSDLQSYISWSLKSRSFQNRLDDGNVDPSLVHNTKQSVQSSLSNTNDNLRYANAINQYNRNHCDKKL